MEEVIKLAKAGKSTKEIAAVFGVTQRTAQKWLKSLGLSRSKSKNQRLKYRHKSTLM